MRQLGLGRHRHPKAHIPLADHEWRLPDLARALEMPAATLHNWVQRGWVKARQCPNPPKYWIIWADVDEVERLRTHRRCSAPRILQQRWKGEVPSIAIGPEPRETSS